MVYAIATPFIIPKANKKKRANLGDGLIYQATLGFLGPQGCRITVTSRQWPTQNEMKRINSTRALILAGANQLSDDFTVFPRLSLAMLEEIKVPIVPFGIGIHGEPTKNTGIYPEAKEILLAIHRKIRYSSWRCARTIAYLKMNCPEIDGQLLMTGCPVMFHDKLLSGTPFGNAARRIVVTLTDRGDFWTRETALLDFVSRIYPKAEKYASFHQNFDTLIRRGFLASLGLTASQVKEGPTLDIRRYAQSKGFKIVVPRSPKDCIRFYESCDMHFGSRLHAHLLFLSRAKRSYLVGVDGRSEGFSETFHFPICDVHRMEKYLNYDFEIYRHHCSNAFFTMKYFLKFLKKDILQSGDGE